MGRSHDKGKRNTLEHRRIHRSSIRFQVTAINGNPWPNAYILDISPLGAKIDSPPLGYPSYVAGVKGLGARQEFGNQNPNEMGVTLVKLKGCLSGFYRVFGLTAALVLVILALSMALPQAAAAGGTWAATGSLTNARDFHTATLLTDGRVLVVGGWDGSIDLSSAELYDPVGKTWNTTGSLKTARDAHTATLLHNGQVLVVWGVGIQMAMP